MARETKHITLLDDGESLLFDISKCDNYIEAILADYIDCTTDEQLKKSISLCFPDNVSDQEKVFGNLKSKFSKIIPGRRKVYYVSVYNENNERVAVIGSNLFGCGLFYARLRVDADLFGNKEEAKELIRKIKSNGVCNKLRYFAKAKVPSDIQYKVTEWKF